MGLDKERRKYVRVNSDDIVRCEKYSIPRVAESERSKAVARNVSGGGILVESAKKYDIGEVLRLEIELPGWEKYKAEFYKPDQIAVSKPFVVIGTVVYCKQKGSKYEIGVDFSGLDEGHRWALIKYLKAKIK